MVGQEGAVPGLCEGDNHPAAENEEHCPRCGRWLGYPNVREAGNVKEAAALERRYREALAAAEADGKRPAVDALETEVRSSCAVVNIAPKVLDLFMTDKKMMYSTYGLQVDAQSRRIADADDDRRRRWVEGMIFGSYGSEIRYAALSLDGRGPKSYGALSMRLSDDAIKDRASLLEQNTYHFCESHGLRGTEPMPSGYRAVWPNRHKLAVAKLAGRVPQGATTQDLAALLMSSNGDRATDEFIEVHIFRGFNSQAVESVLGSTPSGRHRDARAIKAIKGALKKTGRQWIEA